MTLTAGTNWRSFSGKREFDTFAPWQRILSSDTSWKDTSRKSITCSTYENILSALVTEIQLTLRR